MVCRSQWPRGLRRRSTAARLLRSWVRIPPRAWMSLCCECCVLSGRGLCDELITRPEEPYRLWRVVVCDQETSKTRNLKPATFFFFSRRYNPWWVLDCFTILFHNLLSLHFSLQFLTFIFFKSSSTWSSHLSLGLPTGLRC